MSRVSSAGEQELLAVAHAAALAAAAELTAGFASRHDGVRWKSSPTDPVSEADVAAEAAIRTVLARERPGDAILGEEGGATGDAGGLRWIVDPLDGTVNYLYGIPQFAVSIACEDAGGGLVAVVLNPATGETFAATRSDSTDVRGRADRGGGLHRSLARDHRDRLQLRRRCPRAPGSRARPPASSDRQRPPARRRLARHVRLRVGHLRCLLRARRQALGHRGRLADLRPGRALRPSPAAQGILPAGVMVAPVAFADELESLVTAPPTLAT